MKTDRRNAYMGERALERTKRQLPYAIVAETGEYARNWVRSGKVWKQQTKLENGNFETDHITILCDLEENGQTVRQITTVKNHTEKPIALEQVSSAYIAGIGIDGIRPWYDEGRFRLHFCRMCWQGEGQWRSGTLPELGLYRASNHNPANAISISSTGNMSTSMFYPLLYLEDRENGKTWFFEILTSGNWHIELGANEDGGLYVEMNAAWSGHDGWHIALQPDACYTTVPAIYGVVDGGITEAIRERLRWHRQASSATLACPPVCFNDYMNCLWAMPSDQKLIPLIDAAAEAGCEVFCIDDGWQKDGTGTWIPDQSHFGAKGLQGIIDYIRKKGMRPGVWLEIESISHANRAAPSYGRMTRDGRMIGCNGRYQFDFRNPDVQSYMAAVFERLYKMGIRYIKNDFNQTAGIGCDDPNSFSEGIRQETEAFYGFIDQIREKYPDLVIETCASGGMRADNGAMRHFHLYSSSDQEFFWNNPSILAGMMTCTQPEKCGVWAYPYALPCEERMTPASVYFKDRECGTYPDGERTAFNMVSSMLGVLYLSGHIEEADDKNRALIRDAIAIYKQNRTFLMRAYPVYPSGFFRITEEGMYAFGLTDGEKLMMAVWKIGRKEKVKSFPLKDYLHGPIKGEVLYPVDLQTDYHVSNGILTVQLHAEYSARLFVFNGEKCYEGRTNPIV